MLRRLSATFVTALVCSTSTFAAAQTSDPAEPPELPGEPKTAAPEAAPPRPSRPAEPIATAPTASPTPYSADAADAELHRRYDLVRINAGVRLGYMAHRGFDTFAKNDVLTQFSIDGTYPLLTSGKLVLAAGLGWDVGGRSDSIRGIASSLTAHRFYVPVEARCAVLPGLGAFAKVAPGVSLALASVKDSSVSGDLSATGWAFAVDASIGASILLGPRKRLDRRIARFWLTPEIGYAFTTVAKLSPETGRADSDLLGSDERTSLRSLGLSGVFWRASLGTTF